MMNLLGCLTCVIHFGSAGGVGVVESMQIDRQGDKREKNTRRRKGKKEWRQDMNQQNYAECISYR